MIIDSHVHIGGPPSEAEPRNFVKLMKKSKIDKAIVFRYFYNKSTLASNRFIRSAVQNYPKHYVGFAWINPNEKSAVKELRTVIKDWKLKGLKLHLEMNPTSIAKLRDIFKEAEDFSIPICIHIGEDFDSIKNMSEEFDVNIIIAHLGTGVYRLEIERLKKAITLAKRDNVYLETSGNTYPFVDYVAKLVDPSKIILGSDFPHEHPLVSARIVELLNLSSNAKRLILGGNIERILNI